MKYRAVLRETRDGRISGHVPGVLNTTVYAPTERECVARLKAARRASLKRAGEEARDAFAGLHPR